MPKQKMSAAERKAWGEKMKLARAAKKEDIVHNDDIDVLKAQIKELQNKLNLPAIPQGLPSTKQVITKYSFDPKSYPDPREKLKDEERLKRFAFRENYDLNWEVKRMDSEEDGNKIRQPRFELELLGTVIDEDTNEPVKTYDPATKEYREQRYVLKRGMFFEDPDSYMAIANSLNIDVPEYIQVEFLNEMRYLVMRDWLFENFFPPKSTMDKMSKKETVINNRLVTVFEVNSDINEPMPEIKFG